MKYNLVISFMIFITSMNFGQIAIIDHPIMRSISIKIDSSNCSSLNDEIEKMKSNENAKSYGLLILEINCDKIPNEVFGLDWIESIEINNHVPIVIPSIINELVKLQDLKVYGKLSYIEEAVFLPELVSFIAYQTDLVSFPTALLKSTLLKNLSIQDGGIDLIPETISELKELEDLNLSGNQIKFVPGSVIQLSKLKHLGLGNNQLQEFPVEICQIEVIQGVYIVGNDNLVLSDEIKNCLEDRLIYR